MKHDYIQLVFWELDWMHNSYSNWRSIIQAKGRKPRAESRALDGFRCFILVITYSVVRDLNDDKLYLYEVMKGAGLLLWFMGTVCVE